MAGGHHDFSDIHDPLPTDGFRASDVVTLTNQSIDIRPIPSGLLFHARLATTWEFSGFLPSFKDTEGNVVTMSEYLRFPFLDGATIEQVEIPDPKIVAIRERKARAAAKKRAERKRAAGGEGGSKGKPKRRKVSVVHPEEEDSTEEASSTSPLRTVAPDPSFLLKDVDEGTAESREDEHVSVPHHDSANTTHNHTVDHDESFGESRGHGETVETHPADETRLTESPVPARNPEKTVVQDLVPMVRSNLAGDHADGAESSRPGSVYVPEWTIHRRSRVDTPEECRELLTHLAPPAVREEMNAYDNSTAMERAWFSIARGAMAQTDALLRFEALYDAHLALKERCEDVTRQLVSTRTDFTHASNLYNTLSNRYQQVRGEHAGCAEKLINAEQERDELRAVGLLRMRVESRLGYFEKEKIDSIGKLLPTVVKRLLNSHEYKESLSILFNLAIQAGWAKGLAVKRSEKDLMDVLRERRFSGLPCGLSGALKSLLAPPPDAPTRVNPPSQAPDGSKSVPEGANV
ncbi:hypothetical protein Tco_0044300 [Tanacetum coccineum]